MISPAIVPVEQMIFSDFLKLWTFEESMIFIFQGLSYPEMQGSIDTPCLPYLYYNIFPVQYLVCDLNI